MADDATERAWAEQRLACWRRFLDAVDSGLCSNWAGCASVAGHSSHAATELRNVLKAIREGRIVRTADGLAIAKGRRADRAREPGGGDSVGESGVPPVA